MPRVAWSIYDDSEGSESTRLMPDFRGSGPVAAFSEADWRAPSGSSSHILNPLPQQDRSRRWVALGAGLGAVLLVLVVAAMISKDRGTVTTWRGSGEGELALSSIPAPAEIFIDGEPTQLVTPALLRSLPTGRRVRLRVEKDGYAPEEADVQLRVGTRLDRTITLQQMGSVTFEGVAADRTLLVDETPVELLEPAQLEPGEHELRVERDGELLMTKTVVVRPGPQTIQVRE